MNSVIKNRIFVVILGLMLCMVAVFGTSGSVSAKANAAAPSRPDSNSGIVFKRHDSVSIASEVLDIVLSKGSAQITANYVMKNVSDEPIDVETMFLSPVIEGENQNFEIIRNGEAVAFSQEYFGTIDYYNHYDIERWESILAASKTRSKPFGDGDGFKAYVLKNLNYDASTYKTTSLEISIAPTDYYFATGSKMSKQGDNILLQTNYNDILIVTRGEPNIVKLGGDYNLTVSEIPDIYTYLYESAKAGYNQSLEFKFGEQQFNQYLAQIDAKSYASGDEVPWFDIRESSEYVSAVTYFVPFVPKEIVNLSVKYNARLGYGGRNISKLMYYLTPARYWQSFADLTINLTLHDSQKHLISSNLRFDKQDDLTYQYKATHLPDSELQISVSNSKINISSFDIYMIVLAIIVISLIALVIATIVTIVHVKRKNRKNKIKAE